MKILSIAVATVLCSVSLSAVAKDADQAGVVDNSFSYVTSNGVQSVVIATAIEGTLSGQTAVALGASRSGITGSGGTPTNGGGGTAITGTGRVPTKGGGTAITGTGRVPTKGGGTAITGTGRVPTKGGGQAIAGPGRG
jgi:hypothetical protein